VEWGHRGHLGQSEVCFLKSSVFVWASIMQCYRWKASFTNRRIKLTGAICGAAILLQCLSGCVVAWLEPKTGYLIDIQTVLNNWKELEELKDIILSLEFRVKEPEKRDEHREEYLTVYTKEFPQVREKENWIEIVLWYKPMHNIQGRQLKVTLFVWNYVIGNRVPFLKNQIDELGDRVSIFLEEKVGKENVKIRRYQSAFSYW